MLGLWAGEHGSWPDATATVVDLAQRRLVAEVKAPHGLAGLALSPDGATIVLVDAEVPELHLLDTATDTIRGTIMLEGHRQAAQIARCSPDGRRLVVTASTASTAWSRPLPASPTRLTRTGHPTRSARPATAPRSSCWHHSRKTPCSTFPAGPAGARTPPARPGLHLPHRPWPGHPTTASILLAVSGFLQGDGYFDQAIISARRAVDAYQQIEGPDTLGTLTARSFLASAYRAAGDLAAAAPLHQLNLADCARVLGGNHSETLVARANLAYLYALQDEPARALELHQRNLTDYQRVHGPGQPGQLLPCPR